MSTMPEMLAQYIAMRRALGAKLREPAVRLSQFVEFLKNQNAEFITTELALRWAMQPKDAQRATWARRLSIVRRFAMWLNVADPRTQVPPHRLIGGRGRRNPPHIYTDHELERLIAEASRLRSCKGLRAHTYTTLIGLLAATGLRPSEILALARSDVDLQNGILHIRESKFGKSRFVPIHDSTNAALARYAKRRDELDLQRQTGAFFVTESSLGLPPSTVRRTFGKISLAAGLRSGHGRRIGRGPRLQDFRHTFATRRLIDWYRAGLDVERELPKLSTYLGHSDVAHTYWYISADPELLQLAQSAPVSRAEERLVEVGLSSDDSLKGRGEFVRRSRLSEQSFRAARTYWPQQTRMLVHGEDQDLGAGIRGQYFFRGVETAHNRHRYVHHNHVGAEFLAEPYRLLSVCCLSHDLPILHLQNSADALPHNIMIIDNQNAWNCPVPLNENSEGPLACVALRQHHSGGEIWSTSSPPAEMPYLRLEAQKRCANEVHVAGIRSLDQLPSPISAAFI